MLAFWRSFSCPGRNHHIFVVSFSLYIKNYFRSPQRVALQISTPCALPDTTPRGLHLLPETNQGSFACYTIPTSSYSSPVPSVFSTSRISMPTSASSSLSIPSKLVPSSWATCWALKGSWDLSSRSNTPSSQAENITCGKTCQVNNFALVGRLLVKKLWL